MIQATHPAHRQGQAGGLSQLRWRTLLVGSAGMAAASAALWMGYLPVDTAWIESYQALFLGPGLPPVHVPEVPRSGWPIAALPAWLTGAAFMGWLIGRSFGELNTPRRRWMVRAAFASAGLCIAATGLNLGAPPGPNALERDIVRRRFQQAEASLWRQPPPPDLAAYARAQIALHANDVMALKTHGPRVLQAAEAAVHQLARQAGGTPWGELFDPRVVHAIDTRLHGQPLTEVGLQVEREGRDRGNRLAMMLQGLGALTLAGAALVLLVTWHRMCARVWAIGQALHRLPGHPTALAGGGSAPARPESAPPSAAIRPAGRVGSALTGQRKVSLGWRWPLVGVGLLALASAAWLATRPGTKRPPSLADGPHPCALVGVWIGPFFDEGRYRLALADDGRFTVADAAGQPMIQGLWSTQEGHTLTLAYTFRSTEPSKVAIEVQMASPDQWQMTGMEVWRYRRAAHLPGRCAR